MSAAIEHSDSRSENEASPALTVRDLLLLRIATGSATRADLQRDVAPLLTPRISGTEFRRSAELALSTLAGAQLTSESKGRRALRAKGGQLADAHFEAFRSFPPTWRAAKAPLVLGALSASDTPSIRKGLARPEGLAALIVQRHFGKTTARLLSPADLRSELAIIALERAFGNKIKTGFGKSAGLPAKAGRLLAGQLFRSPREISTDGKLIIQLACEIVAAREGSAAALELAVLHTLIGPKEENARAGASRQQHRAEPQKRPSRAPAPKPANDRLPLDETEPPPAPRVVSPPDMPEFCQAVVDAARPVSEGWPGNRKAFISLVWKAIRNARPDWGLSEIAFKGMLAEAHRSGRLELATADLKDGRDLKSLEDSKILYKNTVWHFVRVQD
ncbi:MAG: hypothetical protein JSR99_15715 [Proteobacteria bacterium]|nr:hypothetical protein [Pseudomonadota bacterium]